MLHRLRERGVVRVAASYAVIAWLLLQIASVVFDPLGVPKWAMSALVIAAAAGFPIAIALAWFLEIGEHGIEVDTAGEGVARPRTRGLRHYADAIVIGILLVAVVVLAVRQSDIGRPKPPENPAIAVLPFENQSGDPDQEYFSDGLADEMLERLGRVPGLRVIARSSSFSFKGRNLDARTIAEKLGVTTLLEGSVRRDGKRLRLSARLIDGTTGQQTWSGSFDREMADVFDVQSELARAVVEAIIPAARGAVANGTSGLTADLSAYDLYLLARAQLVLRAAHSIPKATELAEQATQADPNFARAYALMAVGLAFQTALFSYDMPPAQSESNMRRAEAAAHRALALDPSLSEAHEALGVLLRAKQDPTAEYEFKRAIEINPNNASAWHNYAMYLMYVPGRQADSDHALERSIELDPRQPATWAFHLEGVRAKGREKFDAALDRAIRTVGDMPTALDRILMPWGAYNGLPVALMRAALLKRQADSGDNLPPWLSAVRAWTTVDPAQAIRAMPPHGDTRHGTDFEVVREFLHAELTALRGDWDGFDREYATLRARYGDSDPTIGSALSFWSVVRGQYGDAAKWLATAAPEVVPHRPMMFGDNEYYGFRKVVTLRTYRATGRTRDADTLAADWLARLRSERRDAGKGCRWDNWLEYASIAANEGYREEAVDALRGAMRCGDVPYGFQPMFPWFKSLEGYAPYDELVRERQRRIDRLRLELLKLEADAGLTGAWPL